MISHLPVKTLLQPFEEPSVVVCARWASLPWVLVARQFIGPLTSFIDLVGLDVVLPVELKERALLLPSLAMPSILHDDLVLCGLGAVVLLAV